MKQTPEYSRSPEDFHVWDTPICSVIAALNAGRRGNLGAAAVHASGKGFRITLDGRTIARGKTCAELHQNFQAAVEKAKAGTLPE